MFAVNGDSEDTLNSDHDANEEDDGNKSDRPQSTDANKGLPGWFTHSHALVADVWC